MNRFLNSNFFDPIILIVNGVARSGKDSFSNFILEHYEIGLIHSTVSTVKAVSCLFFGVDPHGPKGEKERRLWSDLKDAWTRYNDGPFNEIKDQVLAQQSSLCPRPPIIIVHIREPEEIKKVIEAYPCQCTTVLVSRPGIDVPNNHADQNVNGIRYDLEICNSGSLEDLRVMAQYFIAKFIKLDEEETSLWEKRVDRLGGQKSDELVRPREEIMDHSQDQLAANSL